MKRNRQINKKNKFSKKALFIIGILIAAVLIPSPVSLALKGIGLFMVDSATGISRKAFLTFNQEKAIEVYMDYADEEIINQFISENGTVIITDSENVFSQEGIYSTNNGIYARNSDGTSKIYILKTPFFVTSPVFHELGHCLDHMGNRYSSSEEFKEIASKEIANFSYAEWFYDNGMYVMDSYKETGTYEEYFAEAYAFYKQYPHVLKMAAPETYSYFVEMFE